MAILHAKLISKNLAGKQELSNSIAPFDFALHRWNTMFILLTEWDLFTY